MAPSKRTAEPPPMDASRLVMVLDMTRRRYLSASWEREIVGLSICGQMGSGKTNTGGFYLAQNVLAGIQPAVADPHAGVSQGLLTRIERLSPWCWRPPGRNKPAIARTPRECMALIERVHGELLRRVSEANRLPEGQEWTLDLHGDKRIVLYVDELNLLMRGHHKTLIPWFTDFNEQGRKFGVHAVYLAQHWTVAAMGGVSEMRDTIPSTIVHTSRTPMARMVTGLKVDEVQWAPKLPPGWVYVSLTGGHPTQESPGGPYLVPRLTTAYIDMVIERKRAEPKLIATEGIPPDVVADVEPGDQPFSTDVMARIWAERERIYEFVGNGMAFPRAGCLVLGLKPDQKGRLRWQAGRLVEAVVISLLKASQQEAERLRIERDALRAELNHICTPQGDTQIITMPAREVVT